MQFKRLFWRPLTLYNAWYSWFGHKDVYTAWMPIRNYILEALLTRYVDMFQIVLFMRTIEHFINLGSCYDDRNQQISFIRLKIWKYYTPDPSICNQEEWGNIFLNYWIIFRILSWFFSVLMLSISSFETCNW